MEDGIFRNGDEGKHHRRTSTGGDVTDAVIRWLDEKGVAHTRDEVQQALDKLLHAHGDAAVKPS